MSALSIGQCATLACLWEVTIPKPGNVHRAADFDDVTFGEFVASAVAIGPAMDAAEKGASVGRTVLNAVRATQAVACTNTNLGAVLLLAPLAAVPRACVLETGIVDVLDHLDADDAQCVYAAINHAQPGGLGQVDSMDVTDLAPSDLRAAMRAAADRDLIARQYAEDFAQLWQIVVPCLQRDLEQGSSLTTAVIHAHVTLMSRIPDSLIARKCGEATAQQSAMRAARVLNAGMVGSEDYLAALADLDFYLRSDGHRRNPGTTADMIAAGLFVLLREGIIELPVRRFA